MIYDCLGETAQPSPGGSPEAWASYLGALQGAVTSSHTAAVSAYNTLKKVRETLDLPFIVSAGGENPDEGGWSQDLDQQAVDIVAMATLCEGGLADAISGKRRLVWNEQRQGFGIEGLQTDVLRLQYGPGDVPELVDSSGNPTHVSGQVGLAPLFFGALAVASLVEVLALVYLAVKALDAVKIVAEQKTQKTVAEVAKKHADLVAQGKATPEQAEKLDKAVGMTAVELAKAQGQARAEAEKSELPGMVKTLSYVALGVGILYVVAKVLPMVGATTATARANPRREPADQAAADELKLYLDNDNRFAIMGGGQGRAISSNLWKKWKKGTYDSARAPQAWSYVVESAARAYAKEFGSTGDWSRTFTPATRDVVARELAADWEAYAKDGTFDSYSPAAA